MKVELQGIYDRGVLDKERLHLRVTQDLNLSYIAVYDTVRNDDASISAGQKICYWFAPLPLKVGENIVLYTRNGTANTENRPDGTIFHFRFRGNNQPIYTDPNSTSVVFELGTWATMK